MKKGESGDSRWESNLKLCLHALRGGIAHSNCHGDLELSGRMSIERWGSPFWVPVRVTGGGLHSFPARTRAQRAQAFNYIVTVRLIGAAHSHRLASLEVRLTVG